MKPGLVRFLRRASPLFGTRWAGNILGGRFSGYKFHEFTQFDVQGSLFESLGAIAPALFKENDKCKLFARRVWPVLAQHLGTISV